MVKLKFYITIIACLMVTVTGIIHNTPIFELSFQLIITIILFYIIGSILQRYLRKNVFFSDNIDEQDTLNKEDEVQE